MPERILTRVHVILIPGFWLDASSWDPVLPALRGAGHTTHPLTLPGLESAEADRAGIGLRDHVDFVIGKVDELEGAVALVGHSGGGAIAHAVADARPERITRVIYVDSGPLADGGVINDELPVDGHDLPLPEWDQFDEADLRDLDDELRAAMRERAIPQPAAVATEPQRLGDPRRYDVPATVIACEFSSEMLKGLIDQDHPYVAELARLKNVEYIDLPTGHWPQFTKPAELAQVLVQAMG